MTIEVLVSTMNRKKEDIRDLLDNMNISTNAVIINQANYEEEYCFERKNHTIKVISKIERGLSKSRNLALKNAKEEICIIADDDVVYKDNYEEIILKEYLLYPDADIIAFQVPTTNLERAQKQVKGNKKVGYINSGKIASFQITFKKESIQDRGLKFDERFGAGAKYSCGEENIWLFDGLKQGLKIIQSSKEIGIVTHEESTWFNGFDDKFFLDKGAIFTRMTYRYSVLWIIQYGFRKYNLYKKNMGIKRSLERMLRGRKEFIKYNDN